MSGWEKQQTQPAPTQTEVRLKLTENVGIWITDYGWPVRPIVPSLHCRLDAMEGSLDEACDSVPALLLPLLEEALPVLRALVNGESEQVDFPAAVDPIGPIEKA